MMSLRPIKNSTILRTGVIGSITNAICCYTPILVYGLGSVGLSAWLGWLDYVLLPTLALFMSLTAYGLWRSNDAETCCVDELHSAND